VPNGDEQLEMEEQEFESSDEQDNIDEWNLEVKMRPMQTRKHDF